MWYVIYGLRIIALCAKEGEALNVLEMCKDNGKYKHPEVLQVLWINTSKIDNLDDIGREYTS
jgi:hypothetical protein|tara:strand:+ start:414 stop:599 length:186 start_codon:yes stop_codon:yes gene_type:complete